MKVDMSLNRVTQAHEVRETPPNWKSSTEQIFAKLFWKNKLEDTAGEAGTNS